jgi:hypothetical protein
LAAGRPVVAKVNKKVRLRELMEHSSSESLHRLSTFLFHHGLVTLKTSDEICLPNRLVEDPAAGLLSHIQPMIVNWSLNLKDVVQTPSEDKIWRLLYTILDGLGTKFDKSFSEGAVQAVVEGVLRVLPDSKLGGVSIVCEEWLDAAPGPAPKCNTCKKDCGTAVELTATDPANVGRKYWKCWPCNQRNSWHPRLRPDMYLKYENDVVLLEFKRIRPENVLRFVSGDEESRTEAWRMKRTNALQDRALIGEGCHLKEKLCHYNTLKDLEDAAQTQCRGYKSALAAKGLTVKMACTVIHWTYDGDCPSALLVKKVQ